MTLFGPRERRQTNPENPSTPLSPTGLAEWLGLAGPRSAAGIDVTPTSSLTMSTVYRCVSLIASQALELPLQPYRRGTYETVTSPLLDDPHPEYPPGELWRLMQVHRALWGNAYAQIIRDEMGQPVKLWPLMPWRVRVGRTEPVPDLPGRPGTGNPSGKWFEVTGDDGVRHPLTPRQVFHVPHLGYDGTVGLSPVAMARQAIGMGLAAEEYAAKLFGSGTLASGFISTEAQLDKVTSDRLKERWREQMLGRYQQHDVGVLDAGAKFNQLTMPNTDAQFLESRQFQVPEIGRFYGVPAFLLFATEKSTSWGTGLEQQSIGFSTYDLGPTWLSPLEQRVSKELLLPSHEARFDRSRLLRGDSAARSARAAAMRTHGGFTANEIRAEEGRGPIAGGEVALQPLNMGPLGEFPDDPPDDPPEPPPAPEPPPEPPDPDEEDDEDDADAGR